MAKLLNGDLFLVGRSGKTYQGTASDISEYVNENLPSITPGASGLDDLTDVTLTSLADNQVLVSATGIFVNKDHKLDTLTDVTLSSPAEGDVLVADGSLVFKNKNLKAEVTNILQGNLSLTIAPQNIQNAAYYGSGDKLEEKVGILAVAKHDGTPDDPQTLTLTQATGSDLKQYYVLDIVLPTVPDTFNFYGTIYFDNSGNPFEVEGAGAGNEFPVPSDVKQGDTFTLLPVTGGSAPGDPDLKRELKGWLSRNDATKGVFIQSGSIIVCTQTPNPGSSTPALFAEMGVFDYSPVGQNLESVTTLGNSSTVGIELQNSGLNLTAPSAGSGGSISVAKGNITVDVGDIATAYDKDNLTTVGGDLRIGTRVLASSAGPCLSVPNIDFDRFEGLPDVTPASAPIS